MLAAGLFALSLLPVTLCTPSANLHQHGELVVRSQRPDAPSGFSLYSVSVNPEEPLELVLVIPQGNISGLHSVLLDISDPSSQNYGRHLSKEAVAQYVAPSLDSVKAVDSWLGSNNIEPMARSASGDTLRLRIPVKEANALLDANYETYIHHDTNSTMIRTLSYSLPNDIHDHVALIHPTTQFITGVSTGTITQLAKDTSIPSSCNSMMTPDCLQKLYNIPSTPATAANNSLYVTGFGGAVSNDVDLEGFLATFRPDVEGAVPQIVTLDGSSNTGPGTGEGNFDVQYTVGLATHVPVTFMTIGNATTGIVQQDLLDLVDALLDQETVPLVLTTSYVFDEISSDPEFVAYTQLVCNAFAQLGIRGTSVLFASGDVGVAGAVGGGPSKCDSHPFIASFPSSCPFVTSVGATHGINPELSASFSSGGFSNVFPVPDYQKDTVSSYIQTLGDQYAGRYNNQGRAFPDVSAQGINFAFNLSGSQVLFSGTSASTPTFASVVALLNDRLLQLGKSPLGFLNPLLYSKGVNALNDIVNGSNPGCGTDGFPAAKGWDPVTGLGTPDFNKLLSIITGSTVSPQSTVENNNYASAMRPMNLVGLLATAILLPPIYALFVA